MCEINEMPERVIEFLRYMQYNRKKSIGTVDGYGIDLRLLFKYLRLKKESSKQMKEKDIVSVDISNVDDNFIKSITISDLNSFISYVAIERGNGANAQARKVATIKSFYNYLYKNDILENNVAWKLENVEIPNRQPRYLTLSETKTLVNTVKESNKKFTIRDTTILTVFLNTGIRLSELVGLNIESINFEYKTITVIGKGNKQRSIPMNAQVVEVLNCYLEYRKTIENKVIEEDKNALFIGKNYNRLGKRSIEKTFKEYINNAGLDSSKISIHKFRHTFSTLMYKYGKVDIRSLQKILGHESVSTTQIYTSVDDEQLQNAVNSMPEI